MLVLFIRVTLLKVKFEVHSELLQSELYQRSLEHTTNTKKVLKTYVV